MSIHNWSSASSVPSIGVINKFSYSYYFFLLLKPFKVISPFADGLTKKWCVIGPLLINGSSKLYFDKLA